VREIEGADRKKEGEGERMIGRWLRDRESWERERQRMMG
jgi:hypothetical protein